MIFDSGDDTLVLIRRTKRTDDSGRPVMSERNRQVIDESRITKEGCSFEVHRTTEQQSNTDISTSRARAVLPWDADTLALTEADAVEFMSRVYELEGPIHPWTDLDGFPDHVEIACKWQGG